MKAEKYSELIKDLEKAIQLIRENREDGDITIVALFHISLALEILLESY